MVTLTVASVAGLFATDNVIIGVVAILPDADAGPDQTVASPTGSPVAVTLDGSGSTNAASYSWDLPGSLPNATGVSPTVNLPVGNHTITLTATSASGNTDTDTVGINVTGAAAAAQRRRRPGPHRLHDQRHHRHRPHGRHQLHRRRLLLLAVGRQRRRPH